MVLAAYYVAATVASRRSKVVVCVVVAASLAIWRWYPPGLALAILLQSAAGIYVLLYLKVEGTRL